VWWSPLEPLAWSGLWVSLAAATLAAAAGRAMGLPLSPGVVSLVGLGTFAIYGVDRLRDVARDRATAPRRTAFVERHRRALAWAAVAAAVVAAILAVRIGPGAALVLAPVAALGLAHRRMKHVPYAKSTYITLAWVCVVVLFPAVALGGARDVAWAAFVVGAALYANAIASNVRDAEAAVARIGTDAALRLARIAAGVGLALALVAPPPVQALGLVPVATGLALLGFRADEGYGHVVVDGALLVGGLVAIALHAGFAP